MQERSKTNKEKNAANVWDKTIYIYIYIYVYIYMYICICVYI